MSDVELLAIRDQLDAVSQRLENYLAATSAVPAPTPAAPVILHGLQNAAAFFSYLRDKKVLGATLEDSEVKGVNAILAACDGWPISWTAYALATALIETAGTMEPVREAYWLSKSAAAAWFLKMYDIQGSRPDKAKELGNTAPGDGVKYAGRGYPQMTGKNNYAIAEKKLGLPLLSNPDLALDPTVAANIMRYGMEEGWFTTHTLREYLPAAATVDQFKNARRIINGQDRAAEIAGFAIIFQEALMAGQWK